MPKILLVLPLVLLAACAARDFETRADSLVGANRSELVDAFGQPDARDDSGVYYYAMSDGSCAYKFTLSDAGQVLGWYRRGENCGPVA